MKKTYIVPEFISTNVPGGYSPKDTKTFIGGAAIFVDDVIKVLNTDILWYENSNNEQLNFNIESSYEPKIYSTSVSKNKHSRLYLDAKQSDYQKNRNAKWYLKIDTASVLSDYLFASIKKYRTFEGLTTRMSKYKNVDLTIKDYIRNSVSEFYEIDEIIVYIEYYELSENNTKQFTTKWVNSINNQNKLTNLQIEKNSDESSVLIAFEQWPSTLYTFNFYYDITYKRK